MAIDMVRMPPEMSRGFVSVLDFGTDIVRFPKMGGEERTATREMPCRYWQATKGVFSRARIEEFCGFIQARRGAQHAFRFWDPKDCSTNQTSRNGPPSFADQFLGWGDGVRTTFDLVRTYGSIPGELSARLAVDDRMLPIHGEVDDRLAKCLGLTAGTVFNARVAVNNLETTAFQVDLRNRQIIMATPPAMDAAVTWGGYYDWPARLGEDADANFETVAESWTAESAPNIPLECVPFEKFAPETDDPGGAETVAWTFGSPLLTKSKGKVKRLDPGVGSLTATLEEPSPHNAGGPHLILKNNSTSHAVAILDELTGSTIVTLSINTTAHFFVEVSGATRNWFYVLT